MDYQSYLKERFTAEEVAGYIHEFTVENDSFSGSDPIVIDGEPEYDAVYKIWCVYGHDSKGQYRIWLDENGKCNIDGI